MSDFWSDDIKILYENDNYLDFLPSKIMTRTEQLNAITRLSIYMLIILILFDASLSICTIPLIIIFMTILMNKINKNNNETETVEQYVDSDRNKIHDTDPGNLSVQSGYYDSDNHMHLGSPHGIHSKNLYDSSNVSTKTCRKSTVDNPFMNPSILDFNSDDENRTIFDEACYDTIETNGAVNDEVNKNFNKDLYRDVSDLFNVRGGERQFYTVPSTSVPNDMDGFGNWLFGDVGNCKTDPSKCFPPDNLQLGDDFLYSH